MSPVYFWLIVMIIFVIFELATMGLTSIWFALGALVALAVAAVGGPLWLQIIVFALVGLLTLFCVRNLAVTFFNQNRVKTNADGLIGRKGIVTEAISNIHATGQVTVAGQEWTARSVEEGVIYEEGAMVVIREIRGVKLIVEKE
ncbi:MAG: NfeD family protein [Lachnospiraceae bacterium]|nr:NfeD family protein [Lachnospiraceae bacterium]